MKSGNQGQDVQVIQENKIGDDNVIGDVHGNVSVLESALKQLNENDRLFIVGDLVDRGEDSPGVIALIEETNKKNPGKIFVNRGNHENLCLDCISGLEKLALNPLSKDDLWEVLTKIKNIEYKDLDKSLQERDGVKEIASHVRNGGSWLLSLFENEVRNNKITIGENVVTYSEDSKINMIEKYMASLPYIIIVDGEKQFATVHADMPDNPANLLRLAKNGYVNLSKPKQRYAIWARQNDINLEITLNGRSENSMLAFVGHTIIDSGAPAVRPETNTVNLDVAAYANDIILLVNHTKGTSAFIPANENVNINDVILAKPKLAEAKDTIDKHLQMQLTKQHMVKPEQPRNTNNPYAFNKPATKTIPLAKTKTSLFKDKNTKGAKNPYQQRRAESMQNKPSSNETSSTTIKNQKK